MQIQEVARRHVNHGLAQRASVAVIVEAKVVLQRGHLEHLAHRRFQLRAGLREEALVLPLQLRGGVLWRHHILLRCMHQQRGGALSPDAARLHARLAQRLLGRGRLCSHRLLEQRRQVLLHEKLRQGALNLAVRQLGEGRGEKGVQAAEEKAEGVGQPPPCPVRQAGHLQRQRDFGRAGALRDSL